MVGREGGDVFVWLGVAVDLEKRGRGWYMVTHYLDRLTPLGSLLWIPIIC